MMTELIFTLSRTKRGRKTKGRFAVLGDFRVSDSLPASTELSKRKKAKEPSSPKSETVSMKNKINGFQV